MKRQKHFTSRDMILKSIAAARRKFARLQAAATAEKSSADLFDDNPVERNKHLDEADRLWKKAERLESTRIPKLLRVLAAFDTVPFPVDGLNSEQVVMENKQ